MFSCDDLRIIDEPSWNVESLAGTPVTSMDYNPEGSMITYSNNPGEVSVISSYDGKNRGTMTQSYTSYPIVGCKFNPNDDSFVISVSRDGFIFVFDSKTTEMKGMTRHLGSNLLAMDVDSYGESFGIACADSSIRIYDMNTLQRSKVLVKMTGKNVNSQAAMIYSVKYHPEDSNILLSANASEKILFWDLRTGNYERVIFGPHLKGPGMDIHDNVVITTSHRETKQIEFWDFGTAKKFKDITVEPYNGKSSYITAVSIARNGLGFVVGGTTCTNIVYELKEFYNVGQTPHNTSPIVSLAMSPYGSSFVAGCENGYISNFLIRLKNQE